jgi:hypothetical protein
MATVTTDNRYYFEIAGAIREKNGSSDLYTPAQMAAAIRAIQAGDAMSIETIWEICGYVPNGGLPDDYTLLNYIESSGTQYIDTGFKPNNNTRAVVDAAFTNIGDGKYIFGARAAWANAMFAVYAEADGTQFTYGHGTQTGKASGTVINRHTFDLNKNSLYIDGTLGGTLTANNFQSANSIYLLSCNQNGSPLNYTVYLKIYACQIYDNGTLVRDFVPCINPDGEVGLYDIVGKAFYGNKGTGSFVASAPLVSLPDGYTQADYIESSGTQYIDTGFKPNQNTGVTIDFQLKSVSGWQCIFGVRTGANTKSYSLWHSGSVFGFYYAIVNALFSNLNGTERHRVVAKKNTAVADGASSVSPALSNFNADYSMYLFAVCSDGATQSNASMKLYSCQVYDNGILVRDFVPCTNASGAYGLYDRVNGQFYGNAGTGAFTGA